MSSGMNGRWSHRGIAERSSIFVTAMVSYRHIHASVPALAGSEYEFGRSRHHVHAHRPSLVVHTYTGHEEIADVQTVLGVKFVEQIFHFHAHSQ